MDRLEAEAAEHRATTQNLRLQLERLQDNQKTDTQDLVQLAGKLLALCRATGLELDPKSKELFRRRGWSSTARRGQQP